MAKVDILVGALVKAGARHGKKDRESLTKAHDAIAEMVDGVHCCLEVNKDKTTKANARHSKADMGKIQKAHELIVQLGATCPGKL